METFFVFLDESRCYHQKRDLTADFRMISATGENKPILQLKNKYAMLAAESAKQSL